MIPVATHAWKNQNKIDFSKAAEKYFITPDSVLEG